MAEFVAILARANLALAAAILIVLALRILARRVFGARIAYGLWTLPALAVAAAFLPARITTAPVTAFAPVSETARIILDVPEQAARLAVGPSNPGQALFVLWVTGALAWLALTVWRQRRFLAQAAKGKLGPAVIGVIAPRIIEPSDFAQRFTPDEQRLVLAHEAIHLARHDSRVNTLLAAAQCLCWFNPLVHLGAYRLRLDQELSCDELVISRFPSARSAYAKALMKTQLATRPLPLGCYWPSGTQHPLLERIAMINRDTLGRARLIAGACALAILAAATGVAAWAAQPPQTKPVQAADLCLTNACTDPAALTGKADALKAAIAAGKVGDVMKAGGSAADVVAAMMRAEELAGRLSRGPGGKPLAEILKPGSERFYIGRSGDLSVAFDLDGGNQGFFSTAELSAFPAPPGTPTENEMRGIPPGYAPILAPAPPGPDGTPMKILGYAPPPSP